MPAPDIRCRSVGDRPPSSDCELVPWFGPISLLNWGALGHAFLVLSRFMSAKTWPRLLLFSAPWLLHLGRSLQPTWLLQCYPGLQEIQLCCEGEWLAGFIFAVIGNGGFEPGNNWVVERGPSMQVGVLGFATWCNWQKLWMGAQNFLLIC